MATGTAQQMFVGGDWRPSASGETFEAVEPGDRRADRDGPTGRPRRRPARDRRRARRARRLGAADRVRARREDARGRRRHRVPARRARSHADARPGQAAARRGLRRGRPSWSSTGATAAEDCKRLGGELPNSFSPGKRVMLVRRARGVVGVISPWNWPYTMPAELIAPALACGNAVVWTPAPSTAVCAVALARVHRRRRPAGRACSTSSPARARSSATRSRRTRAPTGSRSSARPRPAGSSRRAAAGKAALLEMGGNGPLVVMDDADVEAAVDATLTACYLCAGQSCTAGERILVHRAVRDEFVELLARRVTERILLGDPFADATTMGPLNNEPVAVKMDEHVGRRRRPRRLGRLRRLARGRIPDRSSTGSRPCSPTSRPTPASRSRRRSARSRRWSRSTHSRRRSRGQRVAVRPARGDLHAEPPGRARVRRPGPHRLGQHQRVEQLLGGHICRSAAAPAPTAASARSAATT